MLRERRERWGRWLQSHCSRGARASSDEVHRTGRPGSDRILCQFFAELQDKRNIHEPLTKQVINSCITIIEQHSAKQWKYFGHRFCIEVVSNANNNIDKQFLTNKKTSTIG